MRHGPHILVSSESGTGKTTFAATLIQKRNPRPVLVQLFDAADKGTPYRRRGDRTVLESWDYGERENVYCGEQLVAVIERWHEKQGKGSGGITMKGGSKVATAKYVRQGVVFEMYLERMRDFADETQQWYAYIHDSSTFCEHAVRNYLSGVMHVADNMMIWAQATDELERFYLNLFPDLDITTVVLSHSVPQKVKQRDDKGRVKMIRGEAGDVPYEVRLPGRLASDIYATFGEVYRGYVKLEKSSPDPTFYLQTRPDGVWRCSSQLGVPDPIGPSPHWKEIYTLAAANRPQGEPE